MNRIAASVFSLTFLCSPLLRAAGEAPPHRKLTAVPFTAVKLDDAFWAPRITTNRDASLPHNFQWCESTGRISNFAKAGGLMEGKFEGIYFNDSDVYKVLEGAAYSLANRRDMELERTADAVIAKIAAAQEDDGYLNSYFTLVEPDKKWTNLAVRHELYCAGHMFEAAVAYFRATGKRTLLDVAVKKADLIDGIFGPDKRHDVPGHEEIELALVKLAELTGEDRYFRLAQFFVDVRGDESQRPKLYGPYCQDHAPVREQSEIVGHAVRAMYLYAGVADVAGYTGDQRLVDAMERLWQSVTGRKMYVTGGIGVQGHGEGFSGDYALPNQDAYCETCAAIGMALWNHRLNLLHADAKYADVVERVMYNGILSGVALDGKTFFYVNPLASGGGHHRQPFYGCACCPTNVVRFIPSVPGYVYAAGEDRVYVNLYAAGKGQVPVAGKLVAITQQTNYPWDGKVKVAIDPPEPMRFRLCLRNPGWSRETVVGVEGDENAQVDAQDGYLSVQREWRPGDCVLLALDMTVRRIEANPKVEADRGRVALQRGPVVYCFEQVDNPEGVQSIMLPREPAFAVEHKPDLLGGVTVIKTTSRDGREVTAIPYYAWDHRHPGPMAVWVYQDGKSRTPDTNDPEWECILYRVLDPATD
ncbi:MAG: glycoside hydrolase family 127 protein [Thermoguttaceae bacterium]|jgi:DUF1680 family protein|nr:glycoside hydrolase family 127 protein [Thermoguttaceae bacterium]